MFFQNITLIVGFIIFLYLLYRWVIKPILINHGIEVDDEPEVKTDHTKRLSKTEEEFKQTKASAEAVKKEIDLKASMSKMNKEIKTADRIIEDGSFEEDK